MIWRQQYVKRLERDLEDWSRRGLVDPANVPAILKSAREGGRSFGLAGILAILGVVLLGFAAMSFVAANWAEMSKLTKLIVLGAGMWGSAGLAIWLAKREPDGDAHPFYAEAAVLLAVILYGVAIMLIGQMYHVGGEYSEGLMLWLIGALIAAWLVPSRAALIGAIVLAPVWSIMAIADDPSRLHWEFLLGLAPAALLATGMGWRAAMNLVILAFGVWVAVCCFWLMGELEWPPATALAIAAIIAIGLFGKGHLAARLIGPFEDSMIHWGLFAAMAATFWLPLAGSDDAIPAGYWLPAGFLAVAALITIAVPYMQKRMALADAAVAAAAVIFILLYPALYAGGGPLIGWIFVVAYFGAAVWCVSMGTRTQDRFAINLGFAAFGVMALYVYFETVGTLLGTATFFAVGGILLIALSVGLERIRRRVIANANPGARTGDAA